MNLMTGVTTGITTDVIGNIAVMFTEVVTGMNPGGILDPNLTLILDRDIEVMWPTRQGSCISRTITTTNPDITTTGTTEKNCNVATQGITMTNMAGVGKNVTIQIGEVGHRFLFAFRRSGLLSGKVKFTSLEVKLD